MFLVKKGLRMAAHLSDGQKDSSIPPAPARVPELDEEVEVGLDGDGSQIVLVLHDAVQGGEHVLAGDQRAAADVKLHTSFVIGLEKL